MDINGNSFEQSVLSALMTDDWWGAQQPGTPAPSSRLKKFLRDKINTTTELEFRTALRTALQGVEREFGSLTIRILEGIDPNGRTTIEISAGRNVTTLIG